MFRTLAAAVLAASLIGGPALAQGNAPTANSTAPAAVKTDVPKTGVKTVKPSHGVRTAKHYKHRKHIAHARHIKHVKHASKLPAKTKPANGRLPVAGLIRLTVYLLNR